MNIQRKHPIKLASWIGAAAPTIEAQAKLEHQRMHARSWLKFGERKSRWADLPPVFRQQAGPV